MKKLTTTVLGLSLFVGSAAVALDDFTSYYPAEDIDSPKYTLSTDIGEGHQTLVKSPIKSETITAFFPKEDVDSTTFVSKNMSEGYSSITTELVKSSIKECTTVAFFPKEDVDSPMSQITC